MVLLVLLTGVRTLACYSGLAIIPTVDLVAHGKYGLEVQFDGGLAAGTVDTQLVNTQFGLSPRFEAGVDFDLSGGPGSRSLFNAKWLLLKEPAVAIGVCNVCSGLRSSPYAVATRPLGPMRFHLGCIGLDGAGRWFAGVDRAATSQLTLMADYTSGPDNAASVGLAHQFTEHLGVLAAIIFPNTTGSEMGFTLHLTLN